MKLQNAHKITQLVRVAAVVVFCALVPSGRGYAEPPPESSVELLRQEVQALREGQRELKRDLEDIRQLLHGKETSGQKAPARLTLPLRDGPAKGERSADIVVVEFSDYQCPYCSQHFHETLLQLEREFISTGKIRYLFRNFPIETIHKNAMFAAEAGLCAGDQGKYWEMHDLLFGTQEALEEDRVFDHAKGLGLDLDAFERCLNGKAKHEAVRTDMRLGTTAGVSGTPTFFIGRVKEVANGQPHLDVYHTISGAQSFESFQTAIDNLLSR